jgi:hypothetical protein
MSTAVSLETFAVGFAGFCCIFYGILGISVICTSTCGDPADNKCMISDDSGSSIQLTPAIASFYCSLAMIVGYILIKVRGSVGEIAEGISTFGSQLRTKTVEGQEMRTFSVRFAVVFFLVFTIVIIFMRFVLLKPLDAAETLDPQQAPLMFALRSTLKKMEVWVVGLGFGMLFAGLLFSMVETWYREGYATKRERNENVDDYGWTDALADKYRQTTNKWGWLTEGGGATIKKTQQNLMATNPGTQHPEQGQEHHDGLPHAHAGGHVDYHPGNTPPHQNHFGNVPDYHSGNTPPHQNHFGNVPHIPAHFIAGRGQTGQTGTPHSGTPIQNGRVVTSDHSYSHH